MIAAFFYLARGRRVSTVFIARVRCRRAASRSRRSPAVGRRLAARRARDAATPHSPHRTNDVFRGVFRDHRAMRVRRLAGASIHRGARVSRAAIFGRATRSTRARATRRRRARRATTTTTTTMGMRRHPRRRARGAASRARRTRARTAARAAKRGGIILSARRAAARGGRARAAREGTGATFDVTLAAAALSLHASGAASRDAASREDGARGTAMRAERVEGNLRARGRRARTAREGRDD